MRWMLAALLVLLTACAGPASVPRTTAPPALRTDIEPVTRLFPAVGAPVAVWWVEERLGSGDAPGPNDYRRTAVVRLAPGTAGELAGLTEAGTAVTAPDVPEPVRPFLPAGPLQIGRELDARLTAAGTITRAWLDPAAGTLVVVSSTT